VIDAQLPLQAAAVAALKSDPSVSAIIAGRVFDRAPAEPGPSYITLGASQSVDDSDACHSLVTCFMDVDCWSLAVGYPEVKRLGAAAAKALDADLAVTGFRIVMRRVERVIYQREADGLTSRAIIRLRYDLQATA
jgi:Protein of unknown function (DUF3168)